MTMPDPTTKHDSLTVLISHLTETHLTDLPDSMKGFWYTPMEVFFSYARESELRIARCHTEPRGEAGLEGYTQGELYLAQSMALHGRKYFRVWPPGDGRYYECCGPRAFARHFELLAQTMKDAAA